MDGGASAGGLGPEKESRRTKGKAVGGGREEDDRLAASRTPLSCSASADIGQSSGGSRLFQRMTGRTYPQQANGREGKAKERKRRELMHNKRTTPFPDDEWLWGAVSKEKLGRVASGPVGGRPHGTLATMVRDQLLGDDDDTAEEEEVRSDELVALWERRMMRMIVDNALTRIDMRHLKLQAFPLGFLKQASVSTKQMGYEAKLCSLIFTHPSGQKGGAALLF